MHVSSRNFLVHPQKKPYKINDFHVTNTRHYESHWSFDMSRPLDSLARRVSPDKDVRPPSESVSPERESESEAEQAAASSASASARSSRVAARGRGRTRVRQRRSPSPKAAAAARATSVSRSRSRSRSRSPPDSASGSAGPSVSEQAAAFFENARLRALNGRATGSVADNAGAASSSSSAAEEPGDGNGEEKKGDVAQGLGDSAARFIPLTDESELDNQRDREEAERNNGPEEIDWCFLCSWAETVSPNVEPDAKRIDNLEQLGVKFFGAVPTLEWARNVQEEYNEVFRKSMPPNKRGRQMYWRLKSIERHFTVHIQHPDVIMKTQLRTLSDIISHLKSGQILYENERGEKQVHTVNVKLLLILMDKQQKLILAKK
jgi:hypothetical protein